jgi:hypothetical protein
VKRPLHFTGETDYEEEDSPYVSASSQARTTCPRCGKPILMAVHGGALLLVPDEARNEDAESEE